jgi:hypothetical protein
LLVPQAAHNLESYFVAQEQARCDSGLGRNYGPTGGARAAVAGLNKPLADIAGANVSSWHKADIDFDAEHVRYWGQSGHL